MLPVGSLEMLLSSRPREPAVWVERRQGCLRSSWSWLSWGAAGRTELGRLSGDGYGGLWNMQGRLWKKGRGRSRVRPVVRRGGSGLDRGLKVWKLVFRHSHRRNCLIFSPTVCIASERIKHTITTSPRDTRPTASPSGAESEQAGMRSGCVGQPSERNRLWLS